MRAPAGIWPKRPAWKSSTACCSSARVFMTNGPYCATGSRIGSPPSTSTSSAPCRASCVASTGTLDPWHPAVLRGSAGLHFALPVLHVDSAEVAGPFVVLDADGDPDAALPREAVLVVGSERSGVGEELRERADLVLALPMRPGVSSLNLATAVAAALYRHR